MNGMGRYDCRIAEKQNKKCNPALQLRPVLYVKAGKTIRLRLINTGSYAMYNFSIEGHRLAVIEMDGIDLDNTNVQTVDVAQIAVGQRYSFISRESTPRISPPNTLSGLNCAFVSWWGLIGLITTTSIVDRGYIYSLHLTYDYLFLQFWMM
jgi:hypothetical protein